MSDEEHHFESKADAGASKTYPQQAGAIRKGGHIVIKNRPCKVPSSSLFNLFWELFVIWVCPLLFRSLMGFGEFFTFCSMMRLTHCYSLTLLFEF
ncbi:Eukaryotic translation initiation factor 5A-1 [Linum perenne]